MDGGYELVRLAGGAARPRLPSVPRAIVLTMRDKTRLTRESLRDLRTVCAETWLQVNPGWRRGQKPDYVRTTAHDLVHAYRHACAVCADVDGPVLIFEEDAILFERGARHYARVDAFLRSERYDIYSLGSFGEFAPPERGAPHHRRFVGKIGFSQAVVWSRRARDALLRRPPGDMHIDVHTLSRMALKYTYERPLIVQLFPTTDNMSSWCIECRGGALERLVVRLWISFLQTALGLDTDPDGWRTLYRLNRLIRFARRGVAFARCAALYTVALVAIYAALGVARPARGATGPAPVAST